TPPPRQPAPEGRYPYSRLPRGTEWRPRSRPAHEPPPTKRRARRSGQPEYECELRGAASSITDTERKSLCRLRIAAVGISAVSQHALLGADAIQDQTDCKTLVELLDRLLHRLLWSLVRVDDDHDLADLARKHNGLGRQQQRRRIEHDDVFL